MATRSQEHVSGFAELVEARSTALLRLAYAVVGDHQLAQDLLQEALVKVYVAWPRLRDASGAEAYARRTIVTTAISWRRRRSFHEPPSRGRSRSREAMPTRVIGSPPTTCCGNRCAASPTPAHGAGAALLRGPVRGRDRGADGLFDRDGEEPALRRPGQTSRTSRSSDRCAVPPGPGGDPMTTTLREALTQRINQVGPAHPDIEELVGLGEQRLRRRRLAAVAGAGTAVAVAIAIAIGGTALNRSADQRPGPIRPSPDETPQDTDHHADHNPADRLQRRPLLQPL